MSDENTSEVTSSNASPSFTAVRCWAEGNRIYVRYETGSSGFVVVQSRKGTK